ncbi:hypothetical protein ARMSODRAFT_1018113 [Armillaria solidipes]|uniref:Uncharacterized protein n=1 Tax=Armillaria solidipes TaxID=1076256 RepID=A0A2H3AHA2_9AGAR|nr:hypothetical protein ARMSODRAFT_1028352 [Armillaria solidipes]PBK58319.1 hypothetical protein ARMSODRAFT_1028356 [Armillaria solidipes]PBK69987.1 hypothetical protein ARMSODRAFT_1018113 [Armillaria solidipes]
MSASTIPIDPRLEGLDPTDPSDAYLIELYAQKPPVDDMATRQPGTCEPQNTNNDLPPRRFNSEGSSEDDTEGPFPFEDESNIDIGTPNPARAYQHSLQARSRIIKLLKEHKKYTQRSLTDLDNFAAAPTLEECLGMIFGSVLEVRDSLQAFQDTQEAEGWKMKDDLKKLVMLYSKAFILSSTAVSFIGEKATRAVLKALRDTKTKGLPAEDDVAGEETLLSEISKALGHNRHQVKEKLLLTVALPSGNQQANIAVVTSKIIGASSQIPATLQLYMRLALVRSQLIKYPELEANKFWPQVDHVCAGFLAKSKEKYTFALNGIYQQDLARFGEPEDVSKHYQTVKLDSPTLSPWVSILNAQFSRVQPRSLTKDKDERPVKRRRLATVSETED